MKMNRGYSGIERRHDYTRKGESGISLKEFILTKIESIELATKIAREVVDHRLEGMNEFREALKDQSSKFVTRDELNSILKDKSSNVHATINLFFSILGFLISLISITLIIHGKFNG